MFIKTTEITPKDSHKPFLLKLSFKIISNVQKFTKIKVEVTFAYQVFTKICLSITSYSFALSLELQITTDLCLWLLLTDNLFFCLGVLRKGIL